MPKLTGVSHHTIHAHPEHCVNQVATRLVASSEIVAVFNEERFPYHHDSGQTLLKRSPDGGRSWLESSASSTHWPDSSTPGVVTGLVEQLEDLGPPCALRVRLFSLLGDQRESCGADAGVEERSYAFPLHHSLEAMLRFGKGLDRVPPDVRSAHCFHARIGCQRQLRRETVARAHL